MGAAALDGARRAEVLDAAQINAGYTILAVAVLSILLTAPLGAILISVLGPRLLTRQESVAVDVDEAAEEEAIALTALEDVGLAQSFVK
jgi:hypothetical protein